MGELRFQGIGADDVGDHLEQFYPLSLLRAPELVSLGVQTAVWHVMATTDEYFAKLFAPVTAPAVRMELSLLDHLRRSGVRVPDVLAAKSGGSPTHIAHRSHRRLRRDAYPVMVMPAEKLRTIEVGSIDRAAATAIGCAIAQMHRVLRQYPHRHHVQRSMPWVPSLSSFDAFVRSPLASWALAGQQQSLRSLDRWMEEVCAQTELSPTLTQSVLHGDLRLEHIRFARDETITPGVPYFFDFSDFFYGPVVADLVILFARLYYEDSIEIACWEELCRWLLDGYCSVEPLNEEDCAAIDPFLVARLLGEIRYLTAAQLPHRLERNAIEVRRRYALATYLRETFAEGGVSPFLRGPRHNVHASGAP